MKIGFDAKRATQNFTGLGNYSRFVVNNLVKFHPENSYILFTPYPVSRKIENEIAKETSLRTVIKQGFRPFWRTFGIREDIKKEAIDIYHGLSNELPLGINKSGAKSVVTIHDLIFLKHPKFYSAIDRKIYDRKARYACNIADKIIAVSECTKKDIIEQYNTDPNRIEVVYQGCFPIFKTTVSELVKEKARKKYKLPSQFVLSIGSIEERKNILLIVKALKYLPNIHFVAIGKQCKYTERVKKYATDNGLSERVHIKSDVPLTDLPSILQSAEIFIYPSLYEGFGIPIVEALCSGVPVIAAKGSCLEEAGGPHSIYVDPYDENELAIELKRILTNNDLKQEMINKGLEYVAQFSDQKCTNRLMEVYQHLIHE